MNINFRYYDQEEKKNTSNFYNDGEFSISSIIYSGQEIYGVQDLSSKIIVTIRGLDDTDYDNKLKELRQLAESNRPLKMDLKLTSFNKEQISKHFNANMDIEEIEKYKLINLILTNFDKR